MNSTKSVQRRASQIEGQSKDIVGQASSPQSTVVDNGSTGVRLQIGNTMLEAVDRLTGMTADDIEVVAQRVMEGARDTQDVLHELARRVREYGLFANERLANFVKTANKCSETARSMHSAFEHQLAGETHQTAKRRGTDVQMDMNALEAEIETIDSERAPPLQPTD
jgi:hypothetical protein